MNEPVWFERPKLKRWNYRTRLVPWDAYIVAMRAADERSIEIAHLRDEIERVTVNEAQAFVDGVSHALTY